MSLLEQLLRNDLVSHTVQTAVALRPKRKTHTGFINICCPLCVQRGQLRPDRRFRCGIICTDGIGVHCFNCGMKARWRIGSRLSRSMRQFLEALGVPPDECRKLAYWADQISNMLSVQPQLRDTLPTVIPRFETISLPSEAKPIDEWQGHDVDLLAAIKYLLSRGEVACCATTYYWSPEMPQRLIIPCYHEQSLVGWIARGINDQVQPRYLKHTPRHYLFNSHYLTGHRQYVLLVEGVFDALAIDGVGVLGASLNDTQIAWIQQSGMQPIVVPDRDKTGKRLAEIAIQQHWPVAIMHYGHHQWWDADIKDADDAVKRYGRLYTIQSILANLTWHEGQIRQRIRFQQE